MGMTYSTCLFQICISHSGSLVNFSKIQWYLLILLAIFNVANSEVIKHFSLSVNSIFETILKLQILNVAITLRLQNSINLIQTAAICLHLCRMISS